MARKKNAKIDVNPICPRCGKAEETAMHRFWECEHNDILEEEWQKANVAEEAGVPPVAGPAG